MHLWGKEHGGLPPPQWGRGKDGTLLAPSEGAPPTRALVLDISLQNREAMNFCCQWHGVTAALENCVCARACLCVGGCEHVCVHAMPSGSTRGLPGWGAL